MSRTWCSIDGVSTRLVVRLMRVGSCIFPLLFQRVLIFCVGHVHAMNEITWHFLSAQNPVYSKVPYKDPLKRLQDPSSPEMGSAT